MTTNVKGRTRRRQNPLGGDSVGRSIGVGAVWLFVVGIVALLVWVLVQSFRDTRAILQEPWGLPTSLEFGNYVTAWNDSGFAQAAWNSTWTAVVSAVLIVAVSAPAAYWLSRYETWITNSLTMYFVLGLGVPLQVVLIPLFVMLNYAGLTNNLGGLVLVYVGTSIPFTLFLLTGFFRSLPKELEEAAAIDGVSASRTFFTIMLPLAKGGILTAFVLQLIAHWNETLLAMTLLQSTRNYTLPVALIAFVQQQTYSGADWGGLFAGLVIVIFPMLVVYLWLGRNLSEGLTLGMGK
ncbi:carbohydrate ABC transporter permease [Propioniciclava coleopterorum]|uniref:Carbohydrate ABC transporter permease n=1 Tax=Propioniciclava coleopterorum TaxID=2714937 RepID=A0A6G7YAB5_9ACTN|nr:carbohydrate ABC transporter permease [Propioniciclava coleopterorum]QIK73710.1 carbohydrate ABC transporter permease [Propioniciclava coleopterorum]